MNQKRELEESRIHSQLVRTTDNKQDFQLKGAVVGGGVRGGDEAVCWA